MQLIVYWSHAAIAVEPWNYPGYFVFNVLAIASQNAITFTWLNFSKIRAMRKDKLPVKNLNIIQI